MKTPILLTLAAVAVIALPVLAYRQVKLNSIRDVTMTVQMLPDRSMQYNAQGDRNEYANLVYTDQGTFQNNDSMFPWKQNSSDVYGQLRKDHKYSCEVAGFRLGFFNMYPNIIRCQDLSS